VEPAVDVDGPRRGLRVVQVPCVVAHPSKQSVTSPHSCTAWWSINEDVIVSYYLS
jgi:hypothetical protein